MIRIAGAARLAALPEWLRGMPAKCMRKRAKVRTPSGSEFLSLFLFFAVLSPSLCWQLLYIQPYVKAYKQLKLHIVHVIQDRKGHVHSGVCWCYFQLNNTEVIRFHVRTDTNLNADCRLTTIHDWSSFSLAV